MNKKQLDKQIANMLVKRLEQFMSEPDIITFAGELTMDLEAILATERKELQPIPNDEALRKQLLDICHKFEDEEFMKVHGKCDMELAAPRCAKRVKALEEAIQSLQEKENK